MKLGLSVAKKITETDLEKLKIGDSVKLTICNKDITEKMWVQVTEILGGKLKGKIDCVPCDVEEVNFGDSISFVKEDVCDILKN